MPHAGVPLLFGRTPEALATEVTRLEQKAPSLSHVLDEQRDGIQKLNAEVNRWKEQPAVVETIRSRLGRRNRSSRGRYCGMLQERSLVLAKELVTPEAVCFV